MSEEPSPHRTQIMVAIITIVGGIVTAIVANMEWGSNGSNSISTAPGSDSGVSQPQPAADSLVGFYERDGLGGSSPILYVAHLGGNEYKLLVTNHGWPWEAAVKRESYELVGHGWFPESKATMTFVGEIQGDGSISAEYRFITKGDGSPANGRIDRHIWIHR